MLTDELTAASNGNGHIRVAAADLAAREQMPRLIARLEAATAAIEALAGEIDQIELDLCRRRESKRLRDARYRQRRRNRRAVEVKA